MFIFVFNRRTNWRVYNGVVRFYIDNSVLFVHASLFVRISCYPVIRLPSCVTYSAPQLCHL